jgi:hypothetical protein
MMDYLASMYIDNELDLDEKVLFVDKVHSDTPFYRDTRALLHQEKLLRMPPDTSMLPTRPPVAAGSGHWIGKMLRPIIFAAAGFAAAGLLLFNLATTRDPAQCFNRFVIYEPAAHQVELAGSFTGWQRTPMVPIGNSGYWELHLNVPSGEHRFAYILDGDRRISDPTLPASEKDDFGGENSILSVEERI